MMNEQAEDAFAEAFVALIKETADPSFGEAAGKTFRTWGTESFPLMGFPTAEQIKKKLRQTLALGREVGADSVSISGGIGVTIGFSFQLPHQHQERTP